MQITQAHPAHSNGYKPNDDSGSVSSSLNAERQAWDLWELMIQIYANRWTQKNGNRPTPLWITQVGSMTPSQMTNVCKACVERCAAGNSWPPDFAEFVGLVAEVGGGRLNLTVKNVLDELTRWRNESYRYSSSEKFPWRHPVLYHICIEIRRLGIERRLTEGEQERLAARLLQKWEKKIAAGFSVPPIRRQIAAPKAPSGLTPAQELHEKYLRRKSAGLVK